MVSDDNGTFPHDVESVCPVCGLKKVSSEKEHVLIHGGALLLDEESESGVQAANLVDNLQAFLFMGWESNHGDGTYAELEIARDVTKGQFSLLFCSTKCMRSFLNTCVDNLEKQIEAVKNEFS